MTAPIRILLAEDSLFVQQVALTILAPFDCRVDAVGDGRKAIAALEADPYDLVLMDIQMPDLDGLEATRRIRSGQTKALDPKVPIVAMTGNDQAGDRELCLAAGMDDYLSKPFTEITLTATLGKWLPVFASPPPAKVGDGEGSREASSGSSIFDRADLTARIGNPLVVDKLIAMFLAQLPPEIERLKETMAADNVSAAWGQAHKIKGMAGNASCRALSAMAYEMEKAGKANDLPAMCTILPWLERQFARAQAEMIKKN